MISEEMTGILELFRDMDDRYMSRDVVDFTEPRTEPPAPPKGGKPVMMLKEARFFYLRHRRIIDWSVRAVRFEADRMRRRRENVSLNENSLQVSDLPQ